MYNFLAPQVHIPFSVEEKAAIAAKLTSFLKQGKVPNAAACQAVLQEHPGIFHAQRDYKSIKNYVWNCIKAKKTTLA